eukprot:6904294-Prymnesium_polylepis.1
MRRSSVLIGSRVFASQTTASGNDRVATRRARAAVGRSSVIGVLAPPPHGTQQGAAARRRGGCGWALG